MCLLDWQVGFLPLAPPGNKMKETFLPGSLFCHLHHCFQFIMLYNINVLSCIYGFPGGSVVKNLSASAGDTVLILGLGRSPGEGNGNSSISV